MSSASTPDAPPACSVASSLLHDCMKRKIEEKASDDAVGSNRSTNISSNNGESAAKCSMRPSTLSPTGSSIASMLSSPSANGNNNHLNSKNSSSSSSNNNNSSSNLSCAMSSREAQLIAQRKPMSVADFMCTCLVNALRDGGIIISYHAVDDALPMIEAPKARLFPSIPTSYVATTTASSATGTPSCNTTSTLAATLTSVSPSAAPQTGNNNNCCASSNNNKVNNNNNNSNLGFASPPSKKVRTNSVSSSSDTIITPLCKSSQSASLKPMETAQRSFSLADRLLAVLERHQQSSGHRTQSNRSSIGGSNSTNNNNSNINNSDKTFGNGDVQANNATTTSSIESSSPTSTTSNGSFHDDLPIDIEDDLRPDPAAASLGPADHTTITPLHWASNLGHEDCVRYLLMAGWNVNLRDMCGYTPLHYAVRSGSVSAVKLLLRAGARPDSRNDLAMTPLHGAILDGALAAAKLLLQSGGNVDCRDINGQTALMFAAQSGRSPADAVEMLLDFNADANLSDMNGETALSCCYRLHRARPNSSAIKAKLAVLLRASRPEAVRPLRWYASREIDPEFAQLSHSVTRLERLAALRVRQLLGRGYLPDLLDKCELPSLIKELLLLKR